MGKAGIPREITKWLDRLDLTYSVRNLTRDLANGFVVAEILSRHYQKDVDMYTYYNGLNMDKRKDNWQRVSKVLQKHGKKCSEADWEPIAHLKKDAALQFIKRYAPLTPACTSGLKRSKSSSSKTR